ncbi:hypothetical protein Rhe02_98870 [Rhizocola hellebori]|uniref:Uncharacterized protein n=1 Tax=Rhizocola hellebori TaxID=1392758 RepID=A0A8J3QJ36_9ACTN|nr:hypothetical protein Rhe02_98870 [Rhizocola hellebori]
MSPEKLEAARRRVQDQLDQHMDSDHGGFCLACQQVAPCETRNAAYRVFLALGFLPRRKPGRWAYRLTHRTVNVEGPRSHP